jgi:Bax protein
MNRKRKLALLWSMVSIAILCFLVGLIYPKLPLTAIMGSQSLDQQQQAFVEFMVPKIDLANEQVFALRKQILLVVDKAAHKKQLTEVEKRFLKQTAAAYNIADFNIDRPASMTELLKRVDIVPTSLVLAQSADESGWGTSHFAQEEHNFFGQHCFVKGCGIIPNGVAPGTFEIAKFNDAQDAINYYLYNLNTNASYIDFRNERARLRAQGVPLTGAALAPCLEGYSVLGSTYIGMVNSIILAHGFSQYDKQYQVVK